MATPKGMRASSDVNHIWIQLRRDVPTEQDIGRSSFKVALCMQPGTTHKLALELMNIAEKTKVRRKSKAGPTQSAAEALKGFSMIEAPNFRWSGP